MHETEYKKFGEGWIERVKARAAFRGYEMGVTNGEQWISVALQES